MKNPSTPINLMQVFINFAAENEIPFNRNKDNQIALAVESNFNTLSTVFQVQENNDGYEHYTHQFDVPTEKRGAIAEAAISEAIREISPVLPRDDDRLFIYGSRTGLCNKTEEEIRDHILDDMGRIAGYDNEKYHVFQHILKEK